MKKTKRMNYFILVILVIALSACNSDVEFELYKGNSLRIAVVGEAPEIKEEQVTFKEISFNEIVNGNLSSYDAVLITEENLEEAAEGQYANIYLHSAIPFFFISAISHIPFTIEDEEYSEKWDWTPGNFFASGFLTTKDGESLNTWGYGLYNDEKTDEHIKNVYSRIFSTIEELTYEK